MEECNKRGKSIAREEKSKRKRKRRVEKLLRTFLETSKYHSDRMASREAFVVGHTFRSHFPPAAGKEKGSMRGEEGKRR